MLIENGEFDASIGGNFAAMFDPINLEWSGYQIMSKKSDNIHRFISTQTASFRNEHELIFTALYTVTR